MTATALPDLPSGVYRHYRGPLYLVFGYGHDANADVLGEFVTINDGLYDVEPLGERAVVVYVGLELDGAHSGARFAVRTAADFHALVHDDGTICPDPIHEAPSAHFCGCGDVVEYPRIRRRFTYVGPTWDGLR